MKNKYTTKFTSKNEKDRVFTLSFQIEPCTHIHVIANVQCYDHRRDVYLNCTRKSITRINWHGTFESVVDYLTFEVEICPTPTGATVSVIEKVITSIAFIENLQPCN